MFKQITTKSSKKYKENSLFCVQSSNQNTNTQPYHKYKFFINVLSTISVHGSFSMVEFRKRWWLWLIKGYKILFVNTAWTLILRDTGLKYHTVTPGPCDTAVGGPGALWGGPAAHF